MGDRGDALLEMIAECHQAGGFDIVARHVHAILDPVLTPEERTRWASSASIVDVIRTLPTLIRVRDGGQAPWEWSDADLLTILFTALDGIRVRKDGAEGAAAIACCAAVLSARRKGQSGESAWRAVVRDLAVSLRSEYSLETIQSLDEEGAIREGVVTRAELEKAYVGMQHAVN